MNQSEKIAIIKYFVPRLREKILGFSAEQLTTAYNAPEWTIAQNVHHLVDSHVNAYIRFKLILTEENATLRPYSQAAFAELADGKDAHIEDSLMILDGLHARWGRMMDTITDWERAGYHPEYKKTISLDDLLNTYSNHCDAHLKQIQEVIDKMVWGA
jgi:hypothetical protein